MRAVVVASLAALVLASATAAPAGRSAAVGATERCAASAVRSAFGRFLVAYNSGDLPQLDALFARGADFRWYSSGPPGARVQSEAYRRQTLLSYFEARSRQRDRLRVLSFRFNGNSQGFGHFAYTLRRSALDYHGARPFEIPGKGAALCDDATTFMADSVRFVVMSLGAPIAH